MQIAMGGCTAQKDKGLIRERAGWVDVVFGTHNTHRVLDLLDRADGEGPDHRDMGGDDEPRGRPGPSPRPPRERPLGMGDDRHRM